MRRAIFLFLLLSGRLMCRASDDGGVLDEINLARTNPGKYAAIVEERAGRMPGVDGRCVEEAVDFLRRQGALEPLRSAAGLVMSAREQVADQGVTGEIGHRGSDGSSPVERIAQEGQWTGRVGENISYGYEDARTIVVTLIVDQGVPDRGHRKNIFRRDFTVAGAALGPHARYGTMCVIDFADGFAEKGEKVAVAEPWRGMGGW